MFSVVAIAFAAAAQAANATTTVMDTVITTWCPYPTTFTYGNSTYTVTEATTLTITDCSCTEEPTVAPTTLPPVGAANAAGVAGAAGVAAAVAYLL